MADGSPFTPQRQASHIEINLGNVFAIGAISLLWFAVATWSTNVVARTTIPVLSQLAIGGQTLLHAA